ncbi:DUF4082 domain-containing protein [Acidipropionibacterium virtanenii]|uniref:DUF4082 domain-containing protein n=1 Tax=Acidipropionibacterium virtanenii TaxID=2057246 RepID=A0A344UTT5_9ACTN|nr:DUF4082 domain-containing protein [Acidipropionibacterium virtanenii]AXE38683.1 hypothetical protein JS278_01519 [Acidipropionibacterium virtanenii]
MTRTTTTPRRRTARTAITVLAAAAALGTVLAAAPDLAHATASTTFGTSAPGHLEHVDEGIPVELGMTFTPSTDGTVSTLRFYKARSHPRTTPSSVSLWNDAGTRLARVAVSRTSATGWINVKLDSPVRLSAGKGYVVSAFAGSGSYSTTRRYFSAARTTRTMTMPRNAGVYTNSRSSAFPRSTYGGSNYWVDTVFSPTRAAPATPTPTPSPTTGPGTTTPTANSSTSSAASSATGLMGWQLNARNVGLAPFGLSCSSLPLYTGSLTPAAGTRISGVRIVGGLDLRNGDIVVERSCIQPRSGATAASGTAAIVSNFVCGADSCPVISQKSIIIRDSEIDASGVPASQIAAACAFRGAGTLQRNYMHGMGSGICFYGTGMKHDAIAEQNYVTGLRSYGQSHNEAATLRDFMRDENPDRVARFTRNRFDIADGNVTAGLFIQSTGEDIDTVLVDGNLIEGGGYNLFLNQPSSGGTYRDARAVNNRFLSTGWGPSSVQGGPGWAEWRDNYRYSPAATAARGAAVTAG